MLLFAVLTLVFISANVLPGNAVTAVLGRTASPLEVRQLTHELQLDQPAAERYASWLTGLATGHLGESMVARQPISSLIAEPVRNSVILAITALLFARSGHSR